MPQDIIAQALATDPGNIGVTYKSSRAALKALILQEIAGGYDVHSKAPYRVPPLWQTNTLYKAGAVVRNSAGRIYVAISSPGNYTSGATEPTHTGAGGVTNAWDGTASQSILWAYLFTPSWPMTDQPDAPTITETRLATTPGGFTSIGVNANKALFGFRGTVPELHVASGGLALPNYLSKSDGTVNYGGSSVVFKSDASAISLQVSSSGQGVGVAMDGRMVTMGALGTLPDVSNVAVWGWNTIDAGSRGLRRWELFFGKDTASLYGLAIPAGSRIWPVSDRLYAPFISDSMLDGSAYGPFLMANVVSTKFGRKAGINIRRMAKGGTGLIATNGGNYTYKERLTQVFSATRKPDLGFTMGSSNDAGQTYAATYAAAVEYLKYWNGNTDAPMFWFGVPPLATGTYSQLQTVDSAIADACAAQGAIFYSLMDPTNPLWVSGQNNSGITWMNDYTTKLGGDLTHPLDWGSMYYADFLFEAFVGSMLPRL